MDSTLRGHVGPELAAALVAWRSLDPAHAHAVAVLAPAFPATGRTTRGGRQYVDGSPLPQDLGATIGRQRPAHGPRPARPSGAGAPDPAPDAGDADVWICDAETEEDLMAIAKVAASRGPQRGLGRLRRPRSPRARGARSRTPVRHRHPLRGTPRGRSCFVVGSLSRVSRDQATGLSARVRRLHGEPRARDADRRRRIFGMVAMGRLLAHRARRRPGCGREHRCGP